MLCIIHPSARNQIFLVSDDYDLSTREMVELIARSIGFRPLLFPFPAVLYRLLSVIFMKREVIERLLGSLQLDISHTKKTLNWSPPQSVLDGFECTVRGMKKTKGCKR